MNEQRDPLVVLRNAWDYVYNHATRRQIRPDVVVLAPQDTFALYILEMASQAVRHNSEQQVFARVRG